MGQSKLVAAAAAVAVAGTSVSAAAVGAPPQAPSPFFLV